MPDGLYTTQSVCLGNTSKHSKDLKNWIAMEMLQSLKTGHE